MKSFSLLLALTLIAGPLVAQNGPTVEEIAIATDVADREPQGVMQTFPADVGQVVCWTRINGAEDGTQIKHVWYRDDQEMARVSLNVGGPTWRTWRTLKSRAPARLSLLRPGQCWSYSSWPPAVEMTTIGAAAPPASSRNRSRIPVPARSPPPTITSEPRSGPTSCAAARPPKRPMTRRLTPAVMRIVMLISRRGVAARRS